jgi:DNA-binding LacI/PurR family transcriptional regulator
MVREPTMADIAARLGVSRQLVSIALRGLPGASSETRERVQKVAEELGYRPHPAARSLRQTKSRHISVAFARSAPPRHQPSVQRLIPPRGITPCLWTAAIHDRRTGQTGHS